MTMRRTAALAFAAAACFTTFACGGDDSGEAATTTAATTDDTEASPTTEATAATAASTPVTVGSDEGGCAWLTAAAATDAIGTPMNLVAGGPGGCFFATESGDGPALQISAIQIAIDVDQYVDESKEFCEGDVIDVEAGDSAWACNSGINPQALVVFGTELVVADVTEAASDEEGVRLAAELATVLTPS